MDASMSTLLLLIGYQQETQTPEISDVVKTSLAIEQFELLSILVGWCSVSTDANLHYERAAGQGTTQGVRPRVT